MCRYATAYRRHYVCLACRSSWKLWFDRDHPQRVCPRCGRSMINAGLDLAIPRRRDAAGWKTLAAILEAGLTFHSCGCSGPGFRPRRWSEVRDRREAAQRRGVPLATMLERRDPWEDEPPGEDPEPAR